MKNEEEILSVGDVAAILRVDPRVVARWTDEGRLTSFRTLGGHRRIRRSDLDAAMRQANKDGES